MTDDRDRDAIVLACERLMEAAYAEAVIVFGSHAPGEAHDASDICAVIAETPIRRCSDR